METFQNDKLYKNVSETTLQYNLEQSQSQPFALSRKRIRKKRKYRTTTSAKCNNVFSNPTNVTILSHCRKKQGVDPYRPARHFASQQPNVAGKRNVRAMLLLCYFLQTDKEGLEKQNTLRSVVIVMDFVRNPRGIQGSMTPLSFRVQHTQKRKREGEILTLHQLLGLQNLLVAN